ncbi:hypothetical protein ISS30_05050 [bacterium]|nr:hypothetical protein [FCB group bacterium]MBL7191042.1 hypothetical protein [bacterium]
MPYNYSKRYFWGAALCCLGIAFLFDTLDIIDIGELISKYWPLILIFIGLKLVLARHEHHPQKFHQAEKIEYSEETNTVNYSHTFGDIRLKFKSSEFTGGYISNVFGNIEVDLDEIELKSGSYYLNLRGVFGDLIVIAPKKVEVKIIASTTFGSTRVKDRISSGLGDRIRYISEGYADAEAKLNIDANQVFGDIRIF